MDETMEQYRKVYRMLQDKESQDIYLNRIDWLISGNYRYIKNIVEDHVPDLPPLGKTTADLRHSMPKDRRVVLYGAGDIGRLLLADWAQDERFVGFCCKTEEKQKNGYLGYPVMSPDELLARKDLNVIISTVLFSEEIMRILVEGGYPRSQIFTVRDCCRAQTDPGQYFAPDFMTYGDEEVFIDAGCFDLGSSLELKKYCGRVKKGLRI